MNDLWPVVYGEPLDQPGHRVRRLYRPAHGEPQYTQRHPDYRRWFVEFKCECERWVWFQVVPNLQARTYAQAHGEKLYAKHLQRELAKQPQGAVAMSVRTALEARAAAYASQLNDVQERLAALDSLPAEPDIDPEEGTVVWWTIRFTTSSRRGRDYTYAAVKANDELWYTTGPHSPKGYTWDDLVSWIADRGYAVGGIWLAEQWLQL